MQKNYTFVTLLTVILAVLGVIAFFVPLKTTDTLGDEEIPVKILMKNKGGSVVFNHYAHAEYKDVRCDDCHHTGSGPGGEYQSCGACHKAEDDAEFFARSWPEGFYRTHMGEIAWKRSMPGDGDLHEMHQDEDEIGEDCQACHHDEDIEEEPGQCSACHKPGGDAEDVALKEAVHERCKDCHDDFFEDGFKESCANCHDGEKTEKYQGPVPNTCASCHGEKAKVRSRFTALHGQCNSCHLKVNEKKSKDEAKAPLTKKEKIDKPDDEKTEEEKEAEKPDCGECHIQQ